MLKVDQIEHIRRAYFRQRKSIREIAREFHHSRKTVRKAIYGEGGIPCYRRKKVHCCPVLDPVKPTIEGWLEEDTRRPRKQRHTARRIYQRLVQEQSFKGSESTVRRYVRQYKGTKKEVFVPLGFDAGLDAQGDWGEAAVILRGQQKVVQFFTLRLCYSRKSFMMAFLTQQQEALFAGHRSAFEFFGGVPHRITYDNPKTLVQKILRGRSRREQEAFVAFRSHYLFESVFCQPGKAHEKGQVEGAIGYVRRNFLVPLPEVDSLEELNAYLLEKCLKEDKRQVYGQTKSIGEAFEEERAKLLPLPRRPYDCCRIVPAQANHLQMVCFETNRYSVPTEFAYQRLLIKAYVDRLEIVHREQVVATHPRCYERQKEILDPVHYLPLLLKKPGALEQARPIRAWKWPPVFGQFWEALKQRYTDGEGNRQFVQVLLLLESYPQEDLALALRLALEYRCPGYDAIVHLLGELEEPTSRPNPLNLRGREYLAAYQVRPQDLAQYDRLGERC